MEEFVQALEGMNPAEVALGAGLVGALVALFAVIGLAWYFISAIGYYQMFKKAGQRGWMAFIPLLQDYVRFKMSWKTGLFWIYLICTICVQFSAVSEQFLWNLLVIAAGIVIIVLYVKLCIRMARSFGKTTGWGVLLFLFPFVVSLILGFGKAEYIGNTTVAAEPSESGL